MEVTERGTGKLLDPAFVDSWLERYVDLWNAHDVEGVVALYTPDVLYHDPTCPEPMRGHDQVRYLLTSLFTALPDYTVHPLEPRFYISSSSPIAASPYRVAGTMLGPLDPQGLAATGAAIESEGISTWEFAGEQVCRYSTYIDGLDLTRQLGVLPRAGSLSHRVMTRAQHLQAVFQRRRNRPAGGRALSR